MEALVIIFALAIGLSGPLALILGGAALWKPLRNDGFLSTRLDGVILVFASFPLIALVLMFSKWGEVSRADLRDPEIATPIGSVSEESVGMHSESRRMSFVNCLRMIRKVAGDLGIAPINIVETSGLRIVRFPVTDGSVLVTCSAADNKLVVTKTGNTCGRDVNC